MKKKDFIKNLICYIVPMVAIFPLSAWGISQMNKATYDCFFVVGPSMQPTLAGDSNNSTYGYSDNSQAAIDSLERFDLVICYYPFSSESDYEQPYIRNVSQKTSSAVLKVKRVIGLPGDTLHIDNETFSISYTLNGEQITESYGGENLKVPFERKTPIENRTADITLGSEEYFVMGDNWTKNGSRDSCNPSIGGDAAPIYKENIDGVIFKLEGTCKYGPIKHCTLCGSVVSDKDSECKCGGTKFAVYDDIIEQTPYEDGPIYLK